MKRVLLLLCLAPTAFAQDREPEGRLRASVEIDSPRASFYVGEPVSLRLRVLFDREYFRDHLVPLFGRELDLQVQVEAPFLAGLPGLSPLPVSPPPPGADLVSLVLDGRVVEAVRAADREWDGRAITVLEVERAFLPTRPGEVAVPAPRLRYALANRFTEDFVNGRRPLDRREEVTAGLPLSLRVLDLPEEGRPPEFAGAVGRFTVEARAEPTEVERGEIFRLALTIEGEGNRSHFPPPRLAGLAGFHLYGSIDDEGAPVRTVVYELAVVGDDVEAVPAIPFAFLDPGPPAVYRLVRTRPIPLRVRGGGGTPPAAPWEPEPQAVPAGSESTSGLLVPAALAVVAVSTLVLLARRRARERARRDPGEDRARAAEEAFESAVSTPGADVAGAFASFLAALLDCPEAAVIAPDLLQRMRAAGVESGLAERAAALLEGLVAARYGGVGAGGGPGAARSLVRELSEAHAASEGDPGPGPARGSSSDRATG